MTRRLVLTLSVLWLATSCFEDRDSDDDQLTTEAEEAAGTDPSSADSDGDGLSDGEEVHFRFTDPTKADTDGDGDEDGWEVEVGLDPLDASDHRYPEGWPHLDVATKDALSADPSPFTVTVGERIRRVELPRLDGQRVDLYDFAAGGRPVLAVVCGSTAVGAVLSWMELGNLSVTHPLNDYEEHPKLRDAVLSGEISLVVIQSVRKEFGDGALVPYPLYPEAIGEPDRYSTSQVYHLVDDGFTMWGHVGLPLLDDPDIRSNLFHPILLDEDMVVTEVGDWDAVLDVL